MVVLEQSGHQQVHYTLMEPTTLSTTQQNGMVVQSMQKPTHYCISMVLVLLVTTQQNGMVVQSMQKPTHL